MQLLDEVMMVTSHKVCLLIFEHYEVFYMILEALILCVCVCVVCSSPSSQEKDMRSIFQAVKTEYS